MLRHHLDWVIGRQAVDLFHAHGTGTIANDKMELAAMENSAGVCRLGPDGHGTPLLYSHKAALGHSLGASGLVAVVINCICHQTGSVPGNINTREPLPTEYLEIEQAATTRPIHRSLIHAAGFGGPTAVVSLFSPLIVRKT